MEENLLEIGKAAAKLGISLRTIRFYEGRGILKTRRRADGTRLLDHEAMKRLSDVSELKELGLTISEIREVIDSAKGGKPALTFEKAEAQLRFLLDQRVKLDYQIALLERKIKLNRNAL